MQKVENITECRRDDERYRQLKRRKDTKSSFEKTAPFVEQFVRSGLRNTRCRKDNKTQKGQQCKYADDDYKKLTRQEDTKIGL
jgi:hypothetical protein